MAGEAYIPSLIKAPRSGLLDTVVSLEFLLGLFIAQKGDKDIKKDLEEVRVTGRQKVKGLPQIIGLHTVKYIFVSYNW